MGYVGLDVAKDKIDVAVRPDGTYWVVAQTTTAIAELVARLRDLAPDLIVAEATGGYEREVVVALRVAGLPVAVVNPTRVHGFARAEHRAKTDRIDAHMLAHFAATFTLRQEPAYDAEAEYLAALQARRQQLVQNRTAEQQRLGTALPKLRDQIQTHIAWLAEQIRTVETDMDGLIADRAVWAHRSQTVQTVKGVGPQTARMLIALLPELGQIAGKQIAALVGVAPYNHDSGTHQGQRHIWGGRAQVRTTLYMAAVVAKTHNPVIEAYYTRLRAAGKPFKVAMVACMHKLLLHLNSLLTPRSAAQAGGAGS